MNTFDLGKIPKNGRIHFIGIGGISMSGLAEIMLGRGYKVSGSDITETHIVKKLKNMGAEIYIGHSADNIKNCDLVVYTAAIHPDNPEYMEAQRQGAIMIDRPTLLGSVMKYFKYAVAVSGTHGKTSTTSMMSHIMLSSECDPTISIGGELPAIGGNIRVGESDYFLCEACEYHQSFLKFFPYISIILNVEEDHLDYFSGLQHIIETFRSLALLTPDDGAVVANIDNENVCRTVKGINKNVITCSIKTDADYKAENIILNESGCGEFDVFENGKLLGRVCLSVPGMHNVSNAICSIAAARYLKLPFEKIQAGLLSYGGVDRRFQKKGIKNGVTVIDDYAHHPTEIRATLSTAKKMNFNNIWCVFQPHTYTRTKTLYPDYIDALSCDINIIIIDIYAAREPDTGLVSSKQLAGDIKGAVYIPDFENCVKFLNENAKEGDLVITMGAGTVFKVGDIYLK